MLLVARLQRLDTGNEHLIRQNAAGRQHFGTANRNAVGIAIHHPRRQERIGLLGGAFGAVGLRVDDDVCQVKIVVAGIAVIIRQRPGTLRIVGLENLKAHIHAENAGRDVVGSPSHEARMQFGPRLKALAAVDERVIAARQPDRSHHFPDKAIWTALDQFRRSSISYLLATTYPNAPQNTDIKFGQVRHINLCAPPFSLPTPLEILREDDDPVTGRVIGVWRRSDIQ